LDTTGVSITLKLYKGADKVWEETYSPVNVVDGIFEVRAGSTVPLDTVAFNTDMFLGITLGNLPEFNPRTSVNAAAMALGMRGMHAVWRDGGPATPRGYTLVGGTPGNKAASGVVGATISGGGYKLGFATYPNEVNAHFATVGGGYSNEAAGDGSTIDGGANNIASGGYSAVGGGSYNRAEGWYSSVAGGYNNKASGQKSLAAGDGARASHRGSFVWSDSVTSNTVFGGAFQSTGNNQFLIGSYGGVGIGTNDPFERLTVAGQIATTGGGEEGGQLTFLDGDGNGGWEMDNFGPTGSEQLRIFRDRGFDNATDVLTIDVAGEVGIGTPLPGATLDIAGGRNDLTNDEGDLRVGSGDYRLKIGVDTDASGAGTARIRSVGGAELLYLGSGTVDVLAVNYPDGVWPLGDNIYDLGLAGKRWRGIHLGSGGVYAASDARMKSDIGPIRAGLDDLMRLRPVSFAWNDEPDSERLGLIAQEVGEIIPEIVRGEESEGMLEMNYTELIPVLIRAIQEQQAQIEELQRRIGDGSR
jgi:hypothetical protein